jgi:hypothetical protein
MPVLALPLLEDLVGYIVSLQLNVICLFLNQGTEFIRRH